MFGEELKLITIQCSVCKQMIALRVDPEDLQRHREQGVYVQHAFVDRRGKPYLTGRNGSFSCPAVAVSAGTCSARRICSPITNIGGKTRTIYDDQRT